MKSALRQITSRSHPLIKRLVRLQHSARQRREENVALLDGIHLLQSYLAADGVPDLLVVSESGHAHPEIHHLLMQVIERNVDCLLVNGALFDKIAPVKTPTGILAQISIPRPSLSTKTDNDAFYLFLEDIQDPGNLGTMLRTAAAAGVSTVFLSPDCADVWSPKTLRAGMGAHFLLQIHADVDLLEQARHFRGQVIVAALTKAENLYQLDLSGPVAFVFGNEGGGVSENMLQAAHRRAFIPMPGRTESLNVGTAAAVCLFEKVRQQYQANHNQYGGLSAREKQETAAHG